MPCSRPGVARAAAETAGDPGVANACRAVPCTLVVTAASVGAVWSLRDVGTRPVSYSSVIRIPYHCFTFTQLSCLRVPYSLFFYVCSNFLHSERVVSLSRIRLPDLKKPACSAAVRIKLTRAATSPRTESKGDGRGGCRTAPQATRTCSHWVARVLLAVDCAGAPGLRSSVSCRVPHLCVASGLARQADCPTPTAHVTPSPWRAPRPS